MSYLKSLGCQTDILAYSWARPAILLAGKGRGGMFLCPRHFQWGTYSFTTVRTYVRPVPSVCPVRNTNSFRAISFEKMVYWIEILYTGIKS